MTAAGGANGHPPAVLCVDDNAEVAGALEMLLARTGRFRWAGWLPTADRLVEEAVARQPGLILVDIDLPGTDPFQAIEILSERMPEARVVMFSGHVHPELVDRALNAGAWGYISKNDGERELLGVLDRVARGEFALSSEVMQVHG